MDSQEIRHLTQLMANDNERAFKQFFDLLYPRFYRLAYHYVKSDVLCDELVSDVFMKIWKNRKKLIKIDRLDFYFFKSIKNQACTYHKRELRVELEKESAKSFRIEYEEPENLLIAKELAYAVEQAISSLPDKCQIIFRLVRENKMSYKDVADLLDVSPKTVENQINIAIKKLKFALDNYYHKDQYRLRKLSFWYLLILFALSF